MNVSTKSTIRNISIPDSKLLNESQASLDTEGNKPP